MIINKNPNKFYTLIEMAEREKSIPKMKDLLINRLEDLIDKIKNEEPFPESEMDLDFIISVDDKIEKILENWYY